MAYRISVQKLLIFFSSVQFEHVPQAHIKHIDELTILTLRLISLMWQWMYG